MFARRDSFCGYAKPAGLFVSWSPVVRPLHKGARSVIAQGPPIVFVTGTKRRRGEGRGGCEMK